VPRKCESGCGGGVTIYDPEEIEISETTSFFSFSITQQLTQILLFCCCCCALFCFSFITFSVLVEERERERGNNSKKGWEKRRDRSGVEGSSVASRELKYVLYSKSDDERNEGGGGGGALGVGGRGREKETAASVISLVRMCFLCQRHVILGIQNPIFVP
jgi:hypothetical protein